MTDGRSAGELTLHPDQPDSVTVSATDNPHRALLTEWDRFVDATPDADVAQLSAWANVRAQVGYRPLYLFAHSRNRLVGGACVLRRRLRPLGWIGYLPYGPLMHPELPEAPIVRTALAEVLGELGHAHAALFVQPPPGGDSLAEQLRQQGFRPSQAGIAPTATIRVDLTQTDAQLLAGLNRRLRTWTRQWPARGVHVRTGNQQDIPLLASLAGQTARHQTFTPFSPDYLYTLYTELGRNGNALILIGEIDHQPVAAELLTGCGTVLKSRITGLDRTHTQAAKLNVASAVIWEAIRRGKDAGYQYYDFGGLRNESVRALSTTSTDAPAPGTPLAGPDQFKTKFGGAPYLYPHPVEYIRSRTLRYGYDQLRRHGRPLLDLVRDTLRGTR